MIFVLVDAEFKTQVNGEANALLALYGSLLR